MLKRLLMRLSERASRLAGLDPRQEREDLRRKIRRYPQDGGPMLFLGHRIVKHMQSLGWPAVIHTCYRSPEDQALAFKRGASKARPFRSAHQYYLAVDIVHASLYWQAPPKFWEDLAASVKAVQAHYGVPLVHGHYWRFVDSAHVELANWRELAREIGLVVPSEGDLDRWFRKVLPRQHKPKVDSLGQSV